MNTPTNKRTNKKKIKLDQKVLLRVGCGLLVILMIFPIISNILLT